MQLLIVLLGISLAAQAADSLQLELYYTGRLLGHARMPDRQTMDLVRGSCKAEPGMSRAGQVLRSQLAALGYTESPAAGTKKALLVSMGDNLAPEYDARMVMLAAPNPPVPKDQLVWFGGQWRDFMQMSKADQQAYDQLAMKGQAEIPFDNVACFLKQLGYNAIVPGKHDFFFGAERLRQFAHLLEKEDVHMLGANLHVVTSEINPAPAVPEWLRRRLMVNGNQSRRYTVLDREVSFKMPKTVYPWWLKASISGIFQFESKDRQRRLRPDELSGWTVESCAPGLPQVCQVIRKNDDAERDSVTVAVKAEHVKVCRSRPGEPSTLDESTGQCHAFSPSLQLSPGDALSGSLEFQVPGDFHVRGASYGLCVEWAVKSREPLCRNYTVAEPLLPKDRPYYIYDGPQGQVAIFGVVGTTNLEAVGKINLSWRRENATLNKLETQVSIADEADSVTQSLQACAQDPACSKAPHKVLLAQMAEDRAGGLARVAEAACGCRFAAVLAESNIRGSTPAQTVERTPDAYAKARALVYSPGPILLTGDLEKLHPHAQKIAIVDTGTVFRIDHRVSSNPVSYKGPGVVAERALVSAVAKPLTFERHVRNQLVAFGVTQKEVDAWSGAEAVERYILESLRRSNGSDLALLQKRDIFRVTRTVLETPLAKETSRELIDRILWKGDFLINDHVKGSVLKEVMDQSRALERQDTDIGRMETERERSLLKLGIEFDPLGEQWLVNGVPLDMDRLYSAAMPDHMVFGDGGYPVLKKPDGLEAPGIRTLHNLVPLAGVVCLGLTDAADCGERKLDAADYLDLTNALAPNANERTRPLERVRSWFLTGLLPRNLLSGGNALERRVQGRSVTSLTLEKAQGGYSLYVHNGGTEQALRNNFPGLTSPQQALAPESNAIDTSTRIRARRTFDRGDLFAVGEANLSRALIRGASNAFVPDVRQNVWSVEGGLNPRLWYSGIHAPEWLGILSIRYESNILNPITTVQTDAGAVRGDLTKTRAWAAKTGVRWAGKMSWFEGGLLWGKRYNVPTTVTAGPDGLFALYEPRPRRGNFLNFRFQVPLFGWKDQFYVMENTGELNYNVRGDIPLDSRIQNVWAHSLQLSLWKNVSLVPKFEVFYFRNKVQNHSVTGLTSKLNLQYRFDWRPGLRWRNARRFPYPPAAK